MNKKILNQLIELGNDPEGVVELLKGRVVVMNDRQVLHAQRAEEAMLDSYVQQAGLRYTKTVSIVEKGGEKYLCKFGGVPFNAQNWFDLNRSCFGPEVITRENFLKSILEEILEKNQTLLTPDAWELFREQIRIGFDLIENYAGRLSPEEITSLKGRADDEAIEAAFWEELEQRRAGLEYSYY